MIRIAVACVIAALAGGCQYAPTMRQTARMSEIFAVSALACDGGTTSQYRHESTFRESNPVLGEHPSDGAVWAYLGAIAVATIGANRVLPPKITTILNALVIGTELHAIHRNMEVGASTCGIGRGGPWAEPDDHPTLSTYNGSH